jgi:short-subunit dehydrogenase
MHPSVFLNKRIFITGGSSGIGKQLATDFLKLGAHVAIVANDPHRLDEARRELAAIRPSVSSFVCDVAELDQVRSVSAAYLREFGAPDVLICNAGYAVYRTFDEMPAEEIARLLAVNLMGACLVAREFLPSMLGAGRGNIVVMASIAGRLVLTPCGIYGAAKHGLVAWARALRIELHHTKVHVHVICPGRVETNFFADESFVTRAPRKETEHTVPIEAVSQAVIRSIENNRFMTYIPKTYGALVWLANAFPFPVETLLNRLMRSRIASIRLAKEK